MSFDKCCEKCHRPMGTACGYGLQNIRFCKKCAKEHRKEMELGKILIRAWMEGY